MPSYVYILASEKIGTLYIGATSDLIKRISEHKPGIMKGFTRDHEVKRLVYYEQHEDIVEAIAREKKLKHWNRAWKIQLIEKTNPQWNDLFEEIAQ